MDEIVEKPSSKKTKTDTEQKLTETKTDTEKQKLKQEQNDTPTLNETDSDESFETKLNSILNHIWNLPDTVEDFELPATIKDPIPVYSKLCKLFKIVESSSFLSSINDEEMDLSYHGFESLEVVAVTKALTYCESVQRLNLSFNKLGSKNLPAITSLLHQNEHITHLNLGSNAIGKKSGELLNNLLSVGHSLKFLDLSGNNMGDDEFTAIGNALLLTNTIKTLNLSRNDIGAISGASFGACIAKCSSLEELDLSSNYLEDGIIGVFNNMKKSNLRILNVSKNGLPDEAMESLARGLRTCKTLKEVDVGSNFISNKGAIILAKGLKKSSVEIFKIAHNPFQGKAASALLRAAGENLKVLDLSGIKVDLLFMKTYRKYSKSGRELKILFGSAIRYDMHLRDQFLPEECTVDESNALLVARKFADEKGISLKNVLRNLHSSYLKEKSTEQENAEAKDQGEKTAEDKSRKITINDLTRGLINSDLEMPKVLARELSTSLADDEGNVDMWEIITKLPTRPDDIVVQIQKEKKESVEKKSKNKKSKKSKGKK